MSLVQLFFPLSVLQVFFLSRHLYLLFYLHLASVFVWFRSKDRSTNDEEREFGFGRAKNGTKPEKFRSSFRGFAPKLHGNTCYTGYIVSKTVFLRRRNGETLLCFLGILADPQKSYRQLLAAVHILFQEQQEERTEQSAPSSPSSNQNKEGLFKEPINVPDAEPHDENLTEQTHHIIIPSYASWFDYNRFANSFNCRDACAEYDLHCKRTQINNQGFQ